MFTYDLISTTPNVPLRLVHAMYCTLADCFGGLKEVEGAKDMLGEQVLSTWVDGRL